MRIDWWTLALQTVNVLILIWILGRFLFRPVADIVAARRAEAAKILADAAAEKTAAETARVAAEAETARIAGSRAEALAAAEKDAAAAKASLIAAAEAEADRLRKAAEAEIRQGRGNEDRRAEERAGRLAVEIAGRLLERLPESVRVAPFVPGLASALAELPAATRADLGAGGPLRLSAPRPLEAGERDAIAAALTPAGGPAPAFTEVVEPALIAGLELEAAHAVVRNSLRADLERIEAELTRHDVA